MPRSWVVPFFVLVLMGTAPAAQAGGIEAVEDLSTVWPLEFMALTDVMARDGAVRVLPSGELGGSRLQADSLRVEVVWQSGIALHGGSPIVSYVTDSGRDVISMRTADVRFAPFGGAPLFLPFADEQEMQAVFTSVSGLTLTGESAPTVVAVGPAPESLSAGETPAPSFWHTMDGAVVQASGGGAVRVDGSFTLFVENVEIHATSETGDWSAWTGDWQSAPDSPVTEFEYRVTTIHVENGTFVSSSNTWVDLFSPSLDVRVDGAITSAGVTGRLMRGDEVLVFDKDPLHLRGSGSLAVSALQPDSGGVVLSLHPSGSFDVFGASRVEDAAQAGVVSAGVAFASLGGIVLAVLAAAGLVVMGVIPVPLPVFRRRRFERFMRRGRQAAAVEEWPAAAASYRKAALAKPDEAIAWYEWAYTELEAGNGLLAETIARRAMYVPGMDPLDLLELRASAAWERRDPEALRERLSELAEASPDMALGLMQVLGVDSSVLEPRVRGALRAFDREEHLDGYV